MSDRLSKRDFVFNLLLLVTQLNTKVTDGWSHQEFALTSEYLEGTGDLSVIYMLI